MMFKTIRIFSEAIDVIREYSPDELTRLSDDIISEIEHANDFEGFQFLVIDGKDVVIIDGTSGDVIDNESISDFVFNTIEYAARTVTENYYE